MGIGGNKAPKGGTVVQCPITHRFVPGMYIREIFMPKNTVLTSKIHKHEHPYVILKGVCEVFTDAGGTVLLEAPHMGITPAGTRRVLRIIEDTTWVTFHRTDKTDLEEIEDEIIEPRVNPYLAQLEEKT